MWWAFDFIIFFFLISVGAFLIEVATEWSRFRRKHLVGTIAIMLAVSWGVIFYGSFVEPRTLIVTNETVVLDNQSQIALKAVVISDIHVGQYKKAGWVEKVVKKIMALEPDIIFLAGDFIFSNPDQADMLEPLDDLDAPFGVWAVTGNHDYLGEGSQYVIDSLEGFGIDVLENEFETIDVNGKEVVIAGVSDLWFEGNVYETLAGLDDEQLVILFAHNPDAVLSPNADRADLVIAGHTHGGQIRLPWIGSLAQVPTMLGNEYDKGLFQYEDQQLFITPGVSETGPRARLFNPPEISLLDIRF